MTDNDIRQIRELTDALQDLEQTLAGSDIAGNLESIARELAQLSGIATTPTNEMRGLHDSLMAFANISGAIASVAVFGDTLKAIKNPKVLAVAGIIAGISLAIGVLGSAFRDNQRPASEFTRGLDESREVHENLRRELERGHRITRNTARALIELGESADGCANAKRIMQGMMDELNRKIPGLGLAFGDYAGSINMSEDALIGYIEAAQGLENHEVTLERLGTLYREQIEVSDQLAKAYARVDRALETGISNMDCMGNQIEGYMHPLLDAAEQAVAYYYERQRQLNAEIEIYSAKVQDITGKHPALEKGIYDAADAIESLKAAYQEAYEAALSSINSQIGLFDRLNFEVSKAAGDMATTWDNQATDFEKHNNNLLFALETNLLPGITSSFADINQAGNLNGIIEELEAAGARFEDGTLYMTEEAEAFVASLNDSFGSQLQARHELAETMAGMEVDIEAGTANILENFEEMVTGLNLSDESRMAGIETIQGLIVGMQSQEGEVAGAISGIGEQILSSLKGILDMNSPSRAMMQIGKGTITGLIDGASSKQGKLSTAYEDLGKTALSAMETASTPLAKNVGQAIGDTAVDGATSVDYGQIPDAMTSAIDGGRGAVDTSMGAVVSDIEGSFQSMKDSATTLTNDTMTAAHTAITTAGQPLTTATEGVKTGILSVLVPFPSAMKNLMNSAMDGMRRAMEAARPDLIRRAQEIATAIQQTIQRAFQINSPSRVMVRLFGKVMDGMYVGMDKGEDAVVEKSDDVAERIRLAFETDGPKMEKLMAQLKASFDHGFIDPKFIIPPSGFGGNKGQATTIYNIHNTAHVTAPNPMSEYQISREMQDMSERMKWKLK